MEKPASLTMPALMDEMAQRFPEREFVVYGEERLTYAQFRHRVRELARGLYGQGVRPGDHVAVWMGNQTEFMLSLFAVTLLGGTAITVNTWYKAEEVAYVLTKSDVSTLIMVERYLNQSYVDMLRGIDAPGKGVPALARVVSIGNNPGPGMTPYNDVIAGASAVDEAVLDQTQATVQPDGVAYMLFTSGTTSFPKGVQLLHRSLVENLYHVGERLHLTEEDRLWLGVSLFWAFGCVTGVCSLMTHGGALVLQHNFEPGEALRLMEEERCTVFLGMPNMILEMMDHADYGKRDVSSLRTGITIATPELMKRTVTFGIREVCQVYGMTETYGVATLSDCKAPEAQRLETVGQIMPGQELVVADPETHAPLPIGEVGEFKLKGHVTPGYYKETERNAESYDADGYLLSGDLGWQDEQGYFHYTGRHKDMIKTGGINVAPAEVEQFLLTQPGVSDASVIAVPDPMRDEAVAAVIVPQAGATLDAQALAKACKAHLAAYKVPRHFRFMQREELPLTATGKVRKVELRDMMANWMAEQEGATKQHGV